MRRRRGSAARRRTRTRRAESLCFAPLVRHAQVRGLRDEPLERVCVERTQERFGLRVEAQAEPGQRQLQVAGVVNDGVMVTVPSEFTWPCAPCPMPNCANACQPMLQSEGFEPLLTAARMPSRICSYVGVEGV